MTPHSWGDPIFSVHRNTFCRKCLRCGIISDSHEVDKKQNPEFKVGTLLAQWSFPWFGDCDSVLVQSVFEE